MANATGAAGGRLLHMVESPGPGDKPPLVIAHGLFGSARNWGGITRRLAAGRRVVAVDLRNHGESFWDDTHSYAAMAADLAAVAETLGAPIDLIGHSMGGKAAMLLALTAPERIGRLIVADIAPIAYSHSQQPLVEAMAALDLSPLDRRSAADAALAPAVPDPGVRAFLLQNLRFDAGGARWSLNLAALGAAMPEIMGFPEMSTRFAGPTLFLSGGASDYVPASAKPTITARFPEAVFEAIPGAGHWLHADAPGPFVAALTAFLDG